MMASITRLFRLNTTNPEPWASGIGCGLQQRRISVLCASLTVIGSVGVYAESLDTELSLNEAAIAAVTPLPNWIPPVSRSDDERWDWLELTSGELLKGEIKMMYRDKMLFESDKLGELTLKWDDIGRIYAGNRLSVRLDNHTTVEGELSLDNGTVTVVDGESRTDVARDDVVALASRRQDRGWLENWTISATIGADFKAGNNNETAYSAMFSMTRRTGLTRYDFSYMGNYAKSNGATTANNQRATTYFDYFFEKQLFFRPVYVSYFRDTFQNIAARVTAGSALGYQIYNEKNFEWEVLAGPAFVATRYETVMAGRSQSISSPAALLQTTVNFDITDDLDFEGTYQFTVTNQQAGLLGHHFVNTLTYDLTDIFNISLTFVWDRIQAPMPTASGNIPKKNDFNLVLGLGVSY